MVVKISIQNLAYFEDALDEHRIFQVAIDLSLSIKHMWNRLAMKLFY